jgi:hypothetical protein
MLIEAKFNARTTVNIDKGKPRLWIAKSGIRRVVAAVRPYTHATTIYKLPEV